MIEINQLFNFKQNNCLLYSINVIHLIQSPFFLPKLFFSYESTNQSITHDSNPSMSFASYTDSLIMQIKASFYNLPNFIF